MRPAAGRGGGGVGARSAAHYCRVRERLQVCRHYAAHGPYPGDTGMFSGETASCFMFSLKPWPRNRRDSIPLFFLFCGLLFKKGANSS